jgi:hypothetical protein
MPSRRDRLLLSALTAISALAASEDAAKPASIILDAGRAKLDRQQFGDLRIQLKRMLPHPLHQHPEEKTMVVTDSTASRIPGRNLRCSAFTNGRLKPGS